MKCMKITLFFALVLAQSISAAHHEYGRKRFSPWQKFVCLLALASGVPGNAQQIKAGQGVAALAGYNFLDVNENKMTGSTVPLLNTEKKPHHREEQSLAVSGHIAAHIGLDIGLSLYNLFAFKQEKQADKMQQAPVHKKEQSCAPHEFPVPTLSGVCAPLNATSAPSKKRIKKAQKKLGSIVCGQMCYIPGKK